MIQIINTFAFLRYVAAITLMSIAVVSVVQSNTEIISIANLFGYHDIIISLSFSILVFCISGFKLAFLFNRYTDKKLNSREIIFLPIEMNFWGYIIPVKGGMIYALVLLKIKYDVTFRSSTSVFLFVQFVILIFGGAIGLVYLINQEKSLSVGVGFTLAMCVFSPVIAVMLARVLDRLRKFFKGYVSRILDFLVDTVGQSVSAFGQWGLVSVVATQTIAHILVTALWLYWISAIIDVELNLFVAMLLVCVQQLSTAVRIVPGNLGVNELLMGGGNFLLGGSFEEGIMLALVIRVTTLFITFTLGSYLVYRNLEVFSVSKMSQLFKQLVAQKDV